MRARGGKILDAATVADIRDTGNGVVVTTAEGSVEEFDAAVLATGAWLGKLARKFGVKNVVQAGRGYSFSVEIDHVPNGPVYFPAQRVACTPIGDRLRVAGMMEFRKPEAALDQRRIQAIAEAARPLLRGANLDDRQDEWVGSRPCTVDGLPLIGATEVAARLRRRRPRHVGHHPRPGHRSPPRPADGHRQAGRPAPPFDPMR